MATNRTPYELAEELLGLAQTLVLELGKGGDAPPGEAPLEVALEPAAAAGSAQPDVEAEEEASPGRQLVGASWAPRSWG